MSLEAEIKNLTDALTRLAEGVEKLLSISQPVAHTAAMQDKIERLAVEVLDTVAEQERAEKNARAAAEKAEPAPPVAPDATAPPTFDDAKRAFLAIAQKFGAVEGTAKSREVLQRYGVPNLKALGAEQYGEFIELCDTVTAGGEV